jgi:hypothetical protein
MQTDISIFNIGKKLDDITCVYNKGGLEVHEVLFEDASVNTLFAAYSIANDCELLMHMELFPAELKEKICNT